MNVFSRLPRWLVALTAAQAFGCSQPPAPATVPAPKPAATASTTKYKLKGVVRSVNAEKGLVTIRHDEIPGFMSAMTMPFAIKDQQLLEDVRVGDEVEGDLEVRREAGEVKDYELKGLVVARPALGPGLSLNVSGDNATIVPAPKVLQPGEQVPDFAMTTQDGKTLRLSDLRGKVVGLTFIFTRCPDPDFCPKMDRKFAEVAEKIAAVPKRAKAVRLLSISFDPEHDTPEVLAKHAKNQGAAPPLWTFAVASHAELSKAAGALGLTYGPAKNEVIHNLVIAVIGPDGTLVQLETGTAARTWEPADLFKTLYSRISD
jgi:protein SCO1